MIERHDRAVFGRNVRAFRILRGWGVRELAVRAGVSTKTVVKIEKGCGCNIMTEQKIALGFSTYIGRLWDPKLLSDSFERHIESSEGRWFFANVNDATLYHQRLLKGLPGEVRMRSDPDEIQDEAERHRLGTAGLSRAFVKTMGGGLATGYFQYNQCELYGRDETQRDAFHYTYFCHSLRGAVRLGIRDAVYEIADGDSLVYEGGDDYWLEPIKSVRPGSAPPLIQFLCLGVLSLRRRPATAASTDP